MSRKETQRCEQEGKLKKNTEVRTGRIIDINYKLIE